MNQNKLNTKIKNLKKLNNLEENEFSRKVFIETILGIQKDLIDSLLNNYFLFSNFFKSKTNTFNNNEVNCSVCIIISSKSGNLKIKDLWSENKKNLDSDLQKRIEKLNKLNPPFFYKPEFEFENNQEMDLEILFLKRTPNPKDRYSGHVCLPGGHRDSGEILFETALRETKEETGIDLTENGKFIFLGNLNAISCFKKKRNGHIVKVTPFVFMHLESTSNLKINLQLKEICDYSWYPFTNLLFQINNFEKNQKKPYYLSLIHI